MQMQTDSDAAHEQITSLEDQLGTEKRRREDAEQDNEKQKQVCSTKRDIVRPLDTIKFSGYDFFFTFSQS